MPAHLALRRVVAVPKVEIVTAGHSITIEDNDCGLDAVATKALELWWATRDPKLDRGYGTAAVTTERDGIYLPEFGAELGRR